MVLGCAFEGRPEKSFDPEDGRDSGFGNEFDEMALRFDLPDENADATDLELEWDGSFTGEVQLLVRKCGSCGRETAMRAIEETKCCGSFMVDTNETLTRQFYASAILRSKASLCVRLRVGQVFVAAHFSNA